MAQTGLSAIKLRPYQTEAISQINSHWADWQRELLVLPTGCGKTVVFNTIAHERPGRTLILAHREELIEQARDKYWSMFGEPTGKIKATENEILRVTVGSIQTMSRRDYTDAFDTVIVDEAHHAISPSYMKLLDQLPKAKVLGVTATPDRGDKRSLARYFDGIAYEYVERQQFKNAERDFEQDIIACAGTISKRYQGSHKRSEAIERIALAIFDGMRAAHGMGERERLLLRLAAILHDCGKFINMTNVGECSHAIIMNTEIIGLSHLERSMVADIVKYNHTAFDYVDDAPGALTVAKLTAILRIANALDKSQKQKVTGVQAVLKDDKLLITVDAGQDLLFEQERFRMHAAFFEEVYGIRPVIKHNG